MPLDKEKLDTLLEEIKRLDTKKVDKKSKLPHQTVKKIESHDNTIKKRYLLPTEKQMYFLISNYYKLTMLSIDDTATALEIWIKAILPLLLQHHGTDLDEWERICDLGDDDPLLEEEQNASWLDFFKNKIEKGLVDQEILILINEGRKRVERMRES
ncbi:MAG: hypothetical protein ACFFAU_21400 [Candidatus Hodarchaeota archaeon]